MPMPRSSIMMYDGSLAKVPLSEELSLAARGMPARSRSLSNRPENYCLRCAGDAEFEDDLVRLVVSFSVCAVLRMKTLV